MNAADRQAITTTVTALGVGSSAVLSFGSGAFMSIPNDRTG
jgi:hypothetical protein